MARRIYLLEQLPEVLSSKVTSAWGQKRLMMPDALFKQKVARAASERYTHAMINFGLFIEEKIKLIQECGLHPLVFVPNEKLDEVPEELRPLCIVGYFKPGPTPKFKNISEVWMAPHRGNLHLPPLYETQKLRFLFPYGEQFFFNNDQIHSWILKQGLTNTFPLTPEGFEIPDSRHHEPCSVDLDYKLVFTTKSQKPSPIISVVIPTYNKWRELTNTFTHLLHQDFDPDFFEVILVDDGSSDSTSERFKDFYKDSLLGRFNVKMLHIPRDNRKLEIRLLRAGLARNLGASVSSAENLVFLDADLIVPDHFLSECINELQSSDVLIWPRCFLEPKISSQNPIYSHIDPQTQSYMPDYWQWQKLYTSKTEWKNLPAGWQYFCTHSFALRAKDFFEAGAFKTSLHQHGFEDTDLAFRLWKTHKKFKLLQTKIYHLHASTRNVEIKKPRLQRFQQLHHAIEVFYRNNLSPEIYQTFHTWISEEKNLTRKIVSTGLKILDTWI